VRFTSSAARSENRDDRPSSNPQQEARPEPAQQMPELPDHPDTVHNVSLEGDVLRLRSMPLPGESAAQLACSSDICGAPSWQLGPSSDQFSSRRASA
jgi:hypothetical protein